MSAPALSPQGRFAQLLRQAVLFVVTCVTLYPVLLVVRVALSDEPGFGADPGLLPAEPTLDNFRRLFGATDSAGDPVFVAWLCNSLIVSLATTVVGIGLSATAAWGFSRFSFPGREAGLRAFLLTQMFPAVVMAVPLYILLDLLHLLDSMLGLTLVYSTSSVPFCVFMLRGYFDTIPRDLEEAAAMDGASRWFTFLHIILPLSRPALAVTALFSFMTAWNEFILAATVLGGERSATLPVALSRYVGQYSADWPGFAAGAIVVSVPVMALFYALQRHLVGGLTAGAVK